VYWIRHLDPTYRFHCYYTDSAWVYAGWKGEYDVCSAATPFREFWAEVCRLRDEWPVLLHVYKTKAHLSAAAVQHSPELMWQRAGNTFADVRAGQGALLHPQSPALWQRHARSSKLALCLVKYFARVLEVVVPGDLLPPRASRPFVVPLLPVHSVALGPGGALRCVRCFRNAGKGGTVGGDCVPRYVTPHYPAALGKGVFCTRCGAYSFARTVRLCGACPGKPPGATVAGRLARMLRGVHPVRSTEFGPPVVTADPLGLFSLLLV
jgi:hypothetical protein